MRWVGSPRSTVWLSSPPQPASSSASASSRSRSSFIEGSSWLVVDVESRSASRLRGNALKQAVREVFAVQLDLHLPGREADGRQRAGRRAFTARREDEDVAVPVA